MIPSVRFCASRLAHEKQRLAFSLGQNREKNTGSTSKQLIGDRKHFLMSFISLIRHGETDYNARGIIQGQLHIPLNEQGMNQAEKLARRLSRERIDLLISSDLLRAKQTAEIIAKNHPTIAHVEYSELFRERSLGEWEGKDFQKYLKVSRANKNFRVKDGESHEEFLSRAKRAKQYLEKRSKELLETGIDSAHIAVITHGGLIRRIIQEYIHPEPARHFPYFATDNASITKIQIHDKQFEGDRKEHVTIMYLNDTCHLFYE